MIRVPEEILIKIYIFLSGSDGVNFLFCNRLLSGLLRSDRVWRKLFWRKFRIKAEFYELNQFLGNGLIDYIDKKRYSKLFLRLERSFKSLSQLKYLH